MNMLNARANIARDAKRRPGRNCLAVQLTINVSTVQELNRIAIRRCDLYRVPIGRLDYIYFSFQGRPKFFMDQRMAIVPTAGNIQTLMAIGLIGTGLTKFACDLVDL